MFQKTSDCTCDLDNNLAYSLPSDSPQLELYEYHVFIERCWKIIYIQAALYLKPYWDENKTKSIGEYNKLGKRIHE